MRNQTDNADFDKFVARQQEDAAQVAAIDWNKQRDEWLKHLDALYAKIQSFLHKYVSSGQVISEYLIITLNEENIGPYKAKQMILRIGRQEVDLIPVGTLLIGAKGRVDVVGPAGRAQILLVDRKAAGLRSLIHVTVGVGGKAPEPPPRKPREVQWEWRILTRPPEGRFIEITQQSFFQLILEVSNG